MLSSCACSTAAVTSKLNSAADARPYGARTAFAEPDLPRGASEFETLPYEANSRTASPRESGVSYITPRQRVNR
jgi:hypothetical protein